MACRRVCCAPNSDKLCMATSNHKSAFSDKITMNRADKKYHRDFDFQHYYKFVPPLLQIILGLITPTIMFPIFYGLTLYAWHFHDVATYLLYLFEFYLVVVFLRYIRYKISWHRGMMRTSAVVGINR